MDPKTNLIITLKELEDCIEKGDEDKLKENIKRFNQDLKLNKQELDELYTSGNQRATQTALILAVCRSNQADILYFLLYETDILDHFPGTDFANEDVKTQRTEAFKFALERDAFPIVELLYDYWSGDLHWDGHDLSKLTTLGKMLEEAREVCEVANQQLMIDIHSLITFNTFQQAFYSSISQIQEPADMLLEVLRFYDEYSDIDKVRIPHVLEETERELRIDLEDKISDFMRMQAYIKYEVSSRDSYIDTAVGYVKVSRTGSECTVTAKIVPEHRISKKLYTVKCNIDEHNDVIIDSVCEDCAASAGQSESKYWHNIRQGRLTASKLYEAAHCKTDGTLVEQILGGYKVPETKSILRGRRVWFKYGKFSYTPDNSFYMYS
ncbi:hypothetical protein PYW07_014078 [Mythimna separata]|uniref:Uncharacterized protein n=1 Tax=Mythimna separata TaxID=271217 RepID=A0AAD7YFY9_MYTSE|nr:hypothetical protein PYW07_014078 [Mythimna separata]